jgi:DNA-directed RNA polymerase specialized sigma24 family protein
MAARGEQEALTISQLANRIGRFSAVDRVAIDFQARANRAGMFHRIANRETDAVNECVQTYGDLVWAIAKQTAPSVSAAEQLTQEIFACIWRSAKNFDPAVFSAKNFVLLVTRHCVRAWESKNPTSRVVPAPARSLAQFQDVRYIQ